MGADIRVENKVYYNGEKEPGTVSNTIFCQGVVYDCLEKPEEFTIFDLVHRRFVLLDAVRHRKVELSTDDVATVNENYRQWAAGKSDGLLRFMASPKFEEKVDEKSGQLTFSSEWITYRVTSTPARGEAVAKQYREFSDWYMLLNTRINPGSRLPYARMAVSEALEKRGELPHEVQLTIRPKGAFSLQKINVRSEHHLIGQLVESDRQRVAQIGQYLAMFQAVSFEDYQKKVGP
jgi:hypothetical protein